MPNPQKYNTRAVHISDRLSRKLNEIPEYPLTFVSAPAGFGKTTAIKHFMSKMQLPIYWYSVLNNDREAFWISFSSMFCQFIPQLSKGMEQIGLPKDAVKRAEFIKLLYSIRFNEKNIFVIDDYHLIGSDVINTLVKEIVKEFPDRIAIVLLSRTAIIDQTDELYFQGYINFITMEHLTFDCSDIKRYYRACGIRLDEQEVKMLSTRSGGWVAFLYVMMLDYIDKGIFPSASNMMSLIENTIYMPLPDDCKDFLLRICLTENFSLEQAKYIGNNLIVDSILKKLFHFNTFIQVNDTRTEFSLHIILRDYLITQFHSLPDAQQTAIYNRTGEWFYNSGDLRRAMAFFYYAGNFDMLWRAYEDDDNRNLGSEDLMQVTNYYSQCPPKIRKYRHMAKILFAYYFSMFDRKLYEQICHEFLDDLNSDNALSAVQKSTYHSYFTIMLCGTKYHDIDEINIKLESALLGLHYKIPCSFGKEQNSSIFTFQKISGGSVRTIDAFMQSLRTTMDTFSRLSDHMSGLENIFAAEVHLYRAQWDMAAVELHYGILKAKRHKQKGILIEGKFIQARLAAVNGEYSAALELIKSVGNIFDGNQLYTRDLFESAFWISAGIPDRAAGWIREGDFENIDFQKSLFPIILIEHLSVLLQQGDYARVVSTAKFYSRELPLENKLIGQYYYLLLAIGCSQLNMLSEARRCMAMAIHILVSEKLILPFVEFGDLALPVLKMYREFHTEIDKITQVYHYYSNMKANITKLYENNSAKLTKREREIAGLVSQGFSNKEIAGELLISTNTVKKTLQNIFSKLHISSRAALSSYLLKSDDFINQS